MLPSYHEIMQTAWLGGLDDGTPCGRGSTLPNTAYLRERLPVIAARYGIRTVVDAGAGDLHWMSHVKWDVEYQGFDLIPRHKDVQELDIAMEVLPKADLILCRFVIGHLDPVNAMMAVQNFKASGSTYLLASNPEHSDYNTDLYGTFNKWDLSSEPFSLGIPIESFPDTCEHTMNLWKL